MSKVRDLHEQWSRDPDYRAAYEALGPEFELARQLIEGYPGTGAGQEELAAGTLDALRLPPEGP